MIDRRVGRICAVLANLQRDPKKTAKPFTEMDFVPQPKREQSAAEQKAILAQIGVS
jgi:hypothetical protein